MEREEILSEIRRCAEQNGGRPLGRERFEAATGIREAQWSGRYWTRWSDVLREAGFEPNAWNAALPDDQLLDALAGIVRQLGHFPTGPEVRMASRADPALPNEKTFGRLGAKPVRVRRLHDWCVEHEGFEDVVAICAPLLKDEPSEAVEEGTETTEPGVVYLVKSGRHFKIGRSNSVGRRTYELAIQLPERLEVVHSIETDDAPGIERYWHERFADRRMNGEWFALTRADVAAFKRRKRFM